MDSTHLHLVANHFPIVGLFIGAAIWIASFLFKRHLAVKNVALSVFILVAVTGLIAYFSGEGAEHALEKMQGIEEDYIEVHEDYGKIFFVTSLILGAFALLALYVENVYNKNLKVLNYILLSVIVVSCWFAVKTGFTGGEIRHTEIRPGFVLEESEE